MTADENKLIVRRLVDDGLNPDNWAAVEAIVADDVVVRDNDHPPVGGRDGIRDRYQAAHAGFPDYHLTVEDLIGEEDRVMMRWAWRGTHTRALHGRPPSVMHIMVSGIAIFRLVNHQVAEVWWAYDASGFPQHMGLMPQEHLSRDTDIPVDRQQANRKDNRS